MKIYIVTEDIPYEGSEIISAHKSEDSAEDMITKLKKDYYENKRHYYSFSYQEIDLLD